ncbi:MAG: OPT/YSL family transporter [Planctomycetota bacterium]|nr:OPT/YSL family transporter [Planctomycetota bacterium]
MEQKPTYRELTPASLIGGVCVGALLNMGICFAGLQIGFTIVGSTVAAVIGFGILRGILRKGSILEVNIFQTVASSVNTVNAGVIFTVPVLFLLGFEENIDYTALLLASVAGSALGVMLIIPLRKQIIDFERLRFPEGTAVATILRSPGAGVEKSRLLIAGILVSAVTIVMVKEKVWGETVDLGEIVGVPATFNLILAVSLLSLGAGFLAGRGGLVVLYGTLLNYWILIPAALLLGWLPDDVGSTEEMLVDVSSLTSLEHGAAAETFFGKFSHFTSRHVGIGMILGGALAGIMLAAPALKAALASLKQGGGEGGKSEEVSLNVLKIGSTFGLLLLLFATKLAGGDSVSWGQAVMVMIAGGVWLWVAGLVVAQTTGRTDWSPLSGLALIAIAIMMGILGTGSGSIVPAVTVGAAICVATSMCADMMADLKTGYLVGSRPAKQQLAQILTCWIGPAIAVATVVLLWKAYGFGPDQAGVLYERAHTAGGATLEAFEAAGGTEVNLPDGVPKLGAPQAGALESAIKIVQSGDVPLGKYIAGALIGIIASLLISPGIGVMVGLSLYLPFEYMAVFGIGGIIALLLARWKGPHWTEDKGVPVAAGLIVGDALVNIIYAVKDVAQSL